MHGGGAGCERWHCRLACDIWVHGDNHVCVCVCLCVRSASYNASSWRVMASLPSPVGSRSCPRGIYRSHECVLPCSSPVRCDTHTYIHTHTHTHTKTTRLTAIAHVHTRTQTPRTWRECIRMQAVAHGSAECGTDLCVCVCTRGCVCVWCIYRSSLWTPISMRSRMGSKLHDWRRRCSSLLYIQKKRIATGGWLSALSFSGQGE